MNDSAATSPVRSDARTIGLIGFAHGTSHFFHLLLPPLFPWLMPAFGLSFTQAGALMTAFFVVSGVGQALSGFVVDRVGPRRVLLAGIACFVLAGLLLALAGSYAMLFAVAALAGLGNSVFHPADFTVLNRKVSPARLGHAFSAHGLSGNIGWAVAPVFLAGIAQAAGWRTAALGAAALGALAWAVVWLRRDETALEQGGAKVSPHRTASTFGFLGVGAVWLCFAFFLLVTTAFGALQNYATPLMHEMYGLPLAAAAGTLTAFLLGGAAGIAAGGVLAGRGASHTGLIAGALGAAALAAALIASGALPAWSIMAAMAAMGFFGGIAGPSRDLLVRRAATARFGQQAYGRVYGFVYSGLDMGLAVSPLLFGPLMDAGRFAAVLAGVALLQAAAILTALRAGKTQAF
ncbi:MAG: MFS transporter [Zoogloeaceae bacterium]|nr:MFS transporter [Zoogloeaceae bacterium]MCK6384428.1 MFS transporter [Rhodocyclaceae bacterium]